MTTTSGMPEGDTIHRAATRLDRALRGKTVRRFETSVAEIPSTGLVGRCVEKVEARGKHMAIAFDDGRVLLSHMKMTGSWHIYREGERWWRPAWTARVVLEVGAEKGDEALVAVCFAAPEVSLITERQVQRALGHLGPDVVGGTFDVSEAVERLRQVAGDRAIAEVLLDQGAVSGIGNIYKSEVLFAERVNPFVRVAAIDDARLTAVLARARALMQRNLDPAGHSRTTVARLGAPRFAVYRRAGRPCVVCGVAIVKTTQGKWLRSTYYCPDCQRLVPPLA